MIDTLPANSVGVMERGFAGLNFLQNATETNKHFLLRIGNSYKLEFTQESELVLVGTGKKGKRSGSKRASGKNDNQNLVM